MAPRKLARAPRPRVTDTHTGYRPCAVCARRRRCMTLEVRASFRAIFGRFAARELLPGAHVCSTCAEGLTLHPSPAHRAPAGARPMPAAAELAEGPRERTPWEDRGAQSGAA